MLTPAQYKALKALDDGSPGPIAVDQDTLTYLVDGLLVFLRPTFKGHVAIREYEAAQAQTKSHDDK